MPSKHRYIECPECSVVKRSDHLARHLRSHQGQQGSALIFQVLSAIDGITFEVFRNFCNKVWGENKHHFITIDLTRSVAEGKYRKNLSGFWKPITEGSEESSECI